MKIFKILEVSIDFSTNFLIFSLASGGSAPPPEPSTNPYFQNFCENFDKLLNISQNFLKNFHKNIKFSLIFLTFFENFRVWKNAKFLLSPIKKQPPPKRDHFSRDPQNAKSWRNYCALFIINGKMSQTRKREKSINIWII